MVKNKKTKDQVNESEDNSSENPEEEKALRVTISDPTTFSSQSERGLDLSIDTHTGLVKPSQLLPNERFKEVNGKTYIEFMDHLGNRGLR